MNFNSIKNEIPKEIRLFLKKALFLFIVWKLVYGFYLHDSQIIDFPLTSHVGDSSAFILNNIGIFSGFEAVHELKTSGNDYGKSILVGTSKIYHNDELLLFIADICNGLELMVLYIGFIICMPSSFWRKLKYIVIGIIIIDLINILRCVGLIWLIEYMEYYFDFAHHYLFKAAVYASTFIMWWYYARKINLKNEALQIG